MSYLVDSDTLMSAPNGRMEAALLLQRHQADGDTVGLVSVGETCDGVLGSSDPNQNLAIARGFLAPSDVLTLDDRSMLRFGQLRVELRRQGQLITGNQRHFQRIPHLMLEGYQ